MIARLRRDRGSFSIELAILAPAVLALFALTVVGGRVNLARQAIEAAAYDAARTASLARTAGDASSEATAAANAALDQRSLSCSSLALQVDTTGVRVPVGQPATVTCRAAFGDVALPGMPGNANLEARFTSPLDTYRSRALGFGIIEAPLAANPSVGSS